MAPASRSRVRSLRGRRLLVPLSIVGLSALGLWSGPAAAAESVARVGAASELPPPVEAETYGASLAVAYLAAPLLALGAGAAVFEATHDDTVAVFAGALTFLTPAVVHVYHGAPEQAGVSFGSMLGVTLLGTLVGGAAGYIVGDISCDDDVESDCDLATIAPTIFGAFAGGVAGYIGHAIYDVSENAVVPSAAPVKAGSVRLWLAPTRAATESKPAGAVSGLKVGAIVNF